MSKLELGPKSPDTIASALKSVFGPLPVVGPMLTELVGNIVPNQRIERLEKFAKTLDQKLEGCVFKNASAVFEDEECVRLFEEAFYQASKATSDERREYIASILGTGLTSEQIEYSESRYLMNLLDELSDVEIIWLRSYLDPTIGGDQEFREKHKAVLDRAVVTMGSDAETRDKGALQDSYEIHLENLGLIKGRVRQDHDGLPVYNKITGEPETWGQQTTLLGRLLLRQIGFKEAEDR
nr:hypothetical protein [uncultured Pseudodesulfovibrio sp.]